MSNKTNTRDFTVSLFDQNQGQWIKIKASQMTENHFAMIKPKEAAQIKYFMTGGY